VDEVRVGTGNQADTAAFHASARPKKFVLRTDGRASTFSVADTEGIQTVKLDQPLQGQVFTLEVLDVEPAEDPAARRACRRCSSSPTASRCPIRRRRSSSGTRSGSGCSGTWYAGDEGNPTGASPSSWTGPGSCGRWSTTSRPDRRWSTEPGAWRRRRCG
jgi:hypothetical protein